MLSFKLANSIPILDSLASEWLMFLTVFLCLLTTLAIQQVGGLLCFKPANNACLWLSSG
jgi:hypothetical protein